SSHGDDDGDESGKRKGRCAKKAAERKGVRASKRDDGGERAECADDRRGLEPRSIGFEDFDRLGSIGEVRDDSMVSNEQRRRDDADDNRAWTRLPREAPRSLPVKQVDGE